MPRTSPHKMQTTTFQTWQAFADDQGGFQIHCYPSGDPLPEALDSLFSREEQAEYTLVEDGMDDAGWIVYLLQRVDNDLVTES